ncbi:MAG: type II secretion system protein GspN, partial [Deltaproteobacteria bacterium]|nr:type II secretion system protein GspN [Nannocystaceae bacterium]
MKVGLKLPSLSITRGELPSGAGGLRPLLRRLRGYVGWAAVSMAFFVVFAWLSLPTRAIAWRIGHEAKKAGYIIDVEDVSVSLLGNITLENVAWTFEPSRPDQIPSKFFVKEVEIDISILSLLIGNLHIEVEARRDEGIIIAEYSRSSTESEVHVAIEELPLYDVPKAYQALNAPLMGYFALKIDLVMPDNKFAKAEGAIEITCAACKIGDGVEKLYIPGSKGLKDGTVIPEIDLGTFVGKLVVEKGTAKTDVAMATTSEDIELSVEGNLKLKDPFPKSRLDLTVKVNLSDALQARSEKLRLVFQSADVKSRLDPPEKGLGYVLSGTIANPSFRGIKSKTARDTRAEKRARQKKRDESKRKKDDAKQAGSAAEAGGDTRLDPRPALPGGATPPPTPGEAGTQPGTVPMPVRPGE